MVFQQFNLWPHMTALGNVTEALVTVKGLSRASSRKAMQRRRVDLPEPDGPIRQVVAPRAISRSLLGAGRGLRLGRPDDRAPALEVQVRMTLPPSAIATCAASPPPGRRCSAGGSTCPSPTGRSGRWSPPGRVIYWGLVEACGWAGRMIERRLSKFRFA
jgi:ABC-type Fe3+/spermidine/putrescine transport system ATPase subunit